MKKTTTVRESLYKFEADRGANAENELMAKRKNYRKAILMSKDICEKLKQILPEEYMHLASELQTSIGLTILAGDELYRQGLKDTVEYFNYIMDRETNKKFII